MATVLPIPGARSRKGSHGVKVDMTPMVDLGFLLITFFIFTTSMMAPTKTPLLMPKESIMPMQVNEKLLLTAIVDKDKVFVYEGAFENAIAANKLRQTDFQLQTGLGYFVRQKQKALASEKDNLMVAIKPLPSASYQDVMNALDEMLINGVKRYGIINLSEEEKQFVSTTH